MIKLCLIVCVMQCIAIFSIAQNTFPSNGNAGAGTSAPVAKMESLIKDSAMQISPHLGERLKINFLANTDGYINGTPQIGFGYTTASNTYVPAAIGLVTVSQGSNTYGDLVFATRSVYDDVRPLERLRITNDGRIGIGTETPKGALLEMRYGSGGTSLNSSITTITCGDYSTFSDGILSIRNAGNRGNIGNAIGSPLFKASFNDATAMIIDKNGNVGINNETPTEKLSVNGNISSKKSIVTQVGWSDYVFNEDYKLRSLSEVAQFIKENKHLPEIPSAQEIKQKGLNLGDNQALLLKKIEELTLYVIDLKSEVEQLKKKVNK